MDASLQIAPEALNAPEALHAGDAAAAAPLLLAWYDAHARRLPWRTPPGQRANAVDPYRVWLSEVMLQQTTVAAAIPYFERFMARWPTVEALAAAPADDVMAAWAGLGYYSRARRLVECAGAVAKLGAFPQTETDLRALPGLGAYTAAAVAAIAFGQRAVVVDANVERVVARLFAIAQPLPAARGTIRAGADAITPPTRCGDFAQAMMDLGAGVCTSRAPKCLICPLSGLCAAQGALTPEAFPVKAPKAARPTRQGRAYWVERQGADGMQVWLVRRAVAKGGGGMLGGMRALPDDGWSARADGNATPPMPAKWRSAGTIDHVFSHFALRLELMVAQVAPSSSKASATLARPPAPGMEGQWWPVGQLDEAGLPTVFSKAAARRALLQEPA